MRSSKGEDRERGNEKGEIKTRKNARGRKEEGNACWQAVIRSVLHFLPYPSRVFHASRAPEIRFAFSFRRLPSTLN